MIDITALLANLNLNQKINYDTLLQKMIADWQANDCRPKILLHSCCAPCSTHTVSYLTRYADVTIYYANSNIHPEAEYQRRKLVQQQFILDYNQQENQNVAFLAAPYQPQSWLVAMSGLEDEPEGGKRCVACYDFRMSRVAEKAAELGFDYFGSALTISPHKNAQVINQVGTAIQDRYEIQYLPSDFKKNNGYQHSVDMCKLYGIYRQCYCGCFFAAKSQGVDLAQINADATAFNQAHPDQSAFEQIHFTRTQ